MLIDVKIGFGVDPALLAVMRILSSALVAGNEKLDRIEAALRTINRNEEKMALDLTALQTELTRETDAVTAVSTLLQKLTAEVQANKNDPAALQAVVDKFRAQNDALVAATLAGTAADPAAAQ